MKKNKIVIGVEISGANIRVGKIKGDKLIKFEEDTLPENEEKDVIVGKILKVIGRFIDNDVEGIGIATTGIVDSENGIMVHPSRLVSLKNLNIRNIVNKEFGKNVYVDNDTNCFALGVKYFGQGKYYKDVVGLIIGEGLGAGIIIDNRLYGGKNSSAGEVGQILYKDSTIEYYSSGQFFKKYLSLDVHEVIEKAKNGDEKSLALMEEYGSNLGYALSMIMLTYDPQIIVFGGYLRKAFELYKKSMWKQIGKSPLKDTLEKIKVEVNNVPNITLLGAAALYYNAQQNKDYEAEKKRRLKAEADLLEERNTLYSILENIPDRIYLKDIEGRYTKVNKAMVEALGYESEHEILGKTDIELFPGVYGKKLYRQDENILKKGEGLLNIENKMLNENHEVVWLLSSKIPLKNLKDKIIGLVGISRDISEIKKAEEKLKAFSDSLRTAKKETDNILENVDEGLFLLNDHFFIGSQYSRALEKIFDTKNIAERNFIEFLHGKIKDEDLNTTEHFLLMLFDRSIDESIINDLNPLQKNKIDIGGVEKTLTFSFKRIFGRKGDVKELMVVVADITEQVKLEEKLRESETKAKKQMEWVMSIMRVEPAMMRDFIDGMKNEFDNIDGYFKIVKKDHEYEAFLDKLYRSIHLIKGNAGILNLSFFADELHLFEDEISEKQNKTLLFDDIKDLFGKYMSIKESVKSVDELLSRMSQLHSQIRTTRSYENEMLIKSLKNYITQISEDTGKKVEFDVSEFNVNIIPYKYKLLLKDIIIQLIKNSVDHGIEEPEEREFIGKSIWGTISLACYNDDGHFCFSVRDDGRGIDVDKLLKKAKSRNLKDIKNHEKMSNNEIAELIFMSGISTKDNVTMLSGRGVGLDAVKNKAERYKGKIDLDYKKGEYCKFTICLPK